jgi:hypothetical protein
MTEQENTKGGLIGVGATWGSTTTASGAVVLYAKKAIGAVTYHLTH